MEALEIVEPFEELKDAAIGAHINTFPDPDGIVRQALLTFNYQGKEIKSFSWEIYREYLKAQHSSEISLPPIDDWNRFYIDFVGEPGDFEHLSYYQVLNGEIPSQYFEEKIVLIGPYAPGLEDYYFTPLDHQTPMYGVEVHANILQNFLYGKYKRSVPDVINILMVLAFGMGVYGGFKKFTASRVFIILLITLSSYIYLAQGLYQQGWRVFLFYPILAGLVLYFLMLGYSYLEEILERKRVTNVFGRYVAPQVVNQILSAGEEGLRLGGARREISVLFVDIRGFTPLAEKAQPEEVVAILNEYLDLCAQAIFKYEGTLDKFIGDAAMAIFNAPLDVKDHAFRAVQAAWAIKEGSKDLEDKLLAQYGRSISFGIGINTGYAVVGNIGSETRMDYTAIGDTVNIGARLESNAKPGQILLSQATYDLVKEKVMVTELGKIKVKGKEQGIFAYQLEGLR